jgi:crotonobetainyl-CoA:carnitine CoA-transferase CaiB-like acyl-CoA transferase
MTTKAILEGIRVTDMSTLIFGPYCTEMLAELGADVVKVEPPTGDAIRFIGRPAKTQGMGKLHMTINRGKRSVCWDIKTEEDRDKMRRLIMSSDVFIHNVRPDAMQRLGFDYDTVRSYAPEIIYVHCTGFDSDGPDAGVPAIDDIIQGASGIAALLAEVEGREDPQYVPMGIADKVAGLYALQATLAALIHKLRFGRGQKVEVPMFETVTAFHLLENFAGVVFPDEPGKKGYRHVSADRRPCPTADGYICISPHTDDRWKRLFEILGQPDILGDDASSAPTLRVGRRAHLFDAIANITPQKTTKEWLDLLRAADIAATPMNDLGDLIKDPQLQAVNFFRERIHPTEGRYLDMRSAVKFSARPEMALGHPARLGEHNQELEEEFNFEPAKEAR